MGNADFFPGIKQPELEHDHSPTYMYTVEV